MLTAIRPLHVALLLVLLSVALLATEARAQAVLSLGTVDLAIPHFNSGGSGAALTGLRSALLHSIGYGSFMPMTGAKYQIVPPIFITPSQAAPNLAVAFAFPVPFRPSQGHDRITFRGLPAAATIKVFTLSGEEVQTLVKSDGATADLIWMPVANHAGQAVASGVYWYAIEGGSARAQGKLMVIR